MGRLMNWRKSPINARHHPLMAGILHRFGKAGYCAYQWMLDLYAIHFDSAGADVPLMMDQKSLKRELDIRLWGTFWGLLRYVNDWPAVNPAAGEAKVGSVEPTYGPIKDRIEPTYGPYRNQIETGAGFYEPNFGREYSSLIPKWMFWKEGSSVFIYIPNFLKSADEWTRKKHRQKGGQRNGHSGADTGAGPEELRRLLRLEKSREDKRKSARGRARTTPTKLFSQAQYQEPPDIIAAYLAAPCREIARLEPRFGPEGFNPWWFLKNNLHKGHHAKAIQKALLGVKVKWASGQDIEAVASEVLTRAASQFGDQWDNAEVLRALMPVFKRVLVPTLVSSEVEA
jgi:hypothetical protein